MKLRMRQNSVRLRLTKSEVALFGETGYLEEAVVFPSGTLRYVLQRSASAGNTGADTRGDTGADTRADFVNGSLTVTVSQATAAVWTDTAAVGIEANSEGLDILIEKDFQCAHGPADEDAFPPPATETISRNT